MPKILTVRSNELTDIWELHMTDRTTILTREDADNAYVLQVTVDQLRRYFDGVEINEVLPDFDLIVDQAQGDVKQSGQRRWIMIEVVP